MLGLFSQIRYEQSESVLHYRQDIQVSFLFIWVQKSWNNCWPTKPAINRFISSSKLAFLKRGGLVYVFCHIMPSCVWQSKQSLKQITAQCFPKILSRRKARHAVIQHRRGVFSCVLISPSPDGTWLLLWGARRCEYKDLYCLPDSTKCLQQYKTGMASAQSNILLDTRETPRLGHNEWIRHKVWLEDACQPTWYLQQSIQVHSHPHTQTHIHTMWVHLYIVCMELRMELRMELSKAHINTHTRTLTHTHTHTHTNTHTHLVARERSYSVFPRQIGKVLASK